MIPLGGSVNKVLDLYSAYYNVNGIPISAGAHSYDNPDALPSESQLKDRDDQPSYL
jgi:hypothetical protein